MFVHNISKHLIQASQASIVYLLDMIQIRQCTEMMHMQAQSKWFQKCECKSDPMLKLDTLKVILRIFSSLFYMQIKIFSQQINVNFLFI